MKEAIIKKHWLLFTFAGYVILGSLIAFATHNICGSMWPLYYDCGPGMATFPEYSFVQKLLFSVANCYSWPVTKLFQIMENPVFDVRAKPFALEIADIKFGLGMIILYALFYTFCTWLVVKVCSLGKRKEGRTQGV